MAKKYERIFAALDGGKTQEQVALRAIQLASDNNAALCFGHVVDSMPDTLTGSDYKELSEAVKKRMKESLADILQEARDDQNIPSVEIVVQVGNIQETLHERIIKPFDPDLVICGERGLSNLTYVFVGSVSTYLIRHLRCDVLVVKDI